MSRLDAKFCVGAEPSGWVDFNTACAAAGDGDTPQDPTHRDDPLLLYFTSGTVSLPKMVLQRQDYALGHVGTARFWHDLRPGDLHWTVTDTGWAKAAWGGLFGQFHERACVMQVALGKPDATTILSILERHGVTSFCAPPVLVVVAGCRSSPSDVLSSQSSPDVRQRLLTGASPPVWVALTIADVLACLPSAALEPL